MEGLAITSRGIEGIACLEINELINAGCKQETGCVIFEFKELKELCLLCYKCQSVDRILYLIGSFEFENFLEELGKFFEKWDFGEWTNYKNFRVECIRIGTHNFNSADAESKISGLIKKTTKLEFSQKDYEIIFLSYIINNKCYLGVDFGGFELNKRGYKIFLHPNSIRGTIAYALVRESGFGKKGTMLDPFSRDGVIPIESAFYAADFPVNFYNKEKFAFRKLDVGIDFEKFFEGIDRKIRKAKTSIYSYDHLFKYVDYSKKNAKIAGVDKQINFSRVDLEWLDIKFSKGSIERIITNPPASKSSNLEKIYNEFFYQSAYILKDNGAIAIISKMPDFVKRHAEKHNFIVLKEKEVWSGEQLLKILIFKKKNI